MTFLEGKNPLCIEKDKCIIRLESLKNSDVREVNNNILSNIKFDSVQTLMQEINKNGIYQIAYWPEGGKLTQNADGTVTAVFRNDKGQIMQHGKLKKIGPDLMNASKAIANQLMLMYIIGQLKEINIKLDTIIQGQHDDRVSEIEGAIKTYQYISADDKKETNKVVDIILQIRTGIAKLEREIKNDFQNIYPNAKFSDNWVSKKNKEIEKKYYIISESIYWIIKGYEILVEWDIAYNPKNAYNHSIEEFISFLESGKWNELIDISRALPYKKSNGGDYPEEIWGRIYEKKPEMVRELNNQLYLSNDNIKEYVIEVNGAQLLEVLQ